jgi:hypothetical protein
VPEPSGWLDPEPPHYEHREMQCRAELPKAEAKDVGRRWRCGTCGRVYRLESSQKDGLCWVKVIDD